MSSPAPAIAKPCGSSRVTNGAEILAGVDGRSEGARRYRDIIAALSAEIGPMGAAEHLQVRAAASMQLQAEALTAALVNGEPVDQEQLSRAANGAIRALAAIRRKAAPKRPTGAGGLRDYLAQKAAKA